LRSSTPVFLLQFLGGLLLMGAQFGAARDEALRLSGAVDGIDVDRRRVRVKYVGEQPEGLTGIARHGVGGK